MDEDKLIETINERIEYLDDTGLSEEESEELQIKIVAEETKKAHLKAVGEKHLEKELEKLRDIKIIESEKLTRIQIIES